MAERCWTIAEAKARLSELLRLANDSPQFIGSRRTHVVVSIEDWRRATATEEGSGRSLVELLQGAGELELPDRSDPEREQAFR